MKTHNSKADTMEMPIDFGITEEESSVKKHVPLTHRTAVKVAAFILAVIMLMITAAGAVGIAFMLSDEMYTTSQYESTQNLYQNIAYTDAGIILDNVLNGNTAQAEEYCQSKNIYSVKITDHNTKILLWSYTDYEKSGGETKLEFSDLYYWDEYTDDEWYEDEYESRIYDASISIDEDLAINDEYKLVYNFMDFMYSMLYMIYPVTLVSLILTAALIVFLVCASGHKKGYHTIQPGWGTKIPLEVPVAAVVALTAGVFYLAGCLYLTDAIEIMLFFSVCGIVLAAALLGLAMSFALRVKLGKWWKNTIIFYVLRLLYKGAKALTKLLSHVPLVWKSALIIAGIALVQLLLMMGTWDNYSYMVVWWVISTLILGGAAFYCSIILKKLQKGGEALASGDLSYQVDTSMLFGDFKKHGESLNSIARGMSIAVEDRLKSERMKTELITNVSHDIKTPLTSIINYTDLISKEPCDNEKINEYCEVLLRQSQRLKRLIDDLVEASKASTGNLEVLLSPCEANILLTQAVGEYEERLKGKNLELITTQPNSPIMIMADGRRLWRVFDNLINNICKYAQGNTRVYLSLEQQENNAVITFKNTSHAPLNISADELMERFVRGDSSRNTEGNGLGLSIAKSLTELQSGTLELSIDGDLFKVTLRFPIIPTP